MESDPLPPGPKSPASWQLYEWSSRPLEMLQRCGEQYGDTFTLRFAGYGTLVMLSDPAAVKEVFRGDPLVLHSGEANSFLGLTVGQSSVIVLDDEPHRRQRSIQSAAFKGERMRSFFSLMTRRTRQSIATWKVGELFRIDVPMREITLGVIMDATLGQDTSQRFSHLAGQLTDLLGLGATRWALIMTKLVEKSGVSRCSFLPFRRQLTRIDGQIYEIIRERKAKLESGARDVQSERDILDDLLLARDDGQAAMSEQEVRDAILTALLAGHETTATALTWAVEQILSSPPVLDRLRAEIDHVTGGDELRAEHLGQLSYLEAVIKEVLRVRTIIPFVTRLLKAPVTIQGRTYAAGTQLCPCIHLVHRRTDIYPDPERFQPERFLDGTFDAGRWLPFGGGNRICLGMQFAMFEMRVVLAVILQTVEFVTPRQITSRVGRRGVVLAPHDGVPVIARRKS